MKVKELLEYWDNSGVDSDISRQIYNHMKKLGYIELGDGVDKWAFKDKDHNVIVIVANDYPSHKVFYKWYEFCKSHSSVHLPQILDTSKFELESKGKIETFVQIKMERLFEATGQVNEAISLLSNMIEYADNLSSNKQGFIKMCREYLETDDESLPFLVSMIDDFDNFIELLAEIVSVGNKYNFDIDLHQYNFMLGSDGNIVIVDPWVA